MLRSTFSNLHWSRAIIWLLVTGLAFLGLYLMLSPPVGAKEIGALAQYEPDPPGGGQGPGGGGGENDPPGGGQGPGGGGGENDPPGAGQGPEGGQGEIGPTGVSADDALPFTGFLMVPLALVGAALIGGGWAARSAEERLRGRPAGRHGHGRRGPPLR